MPKTIFFKASYFRKCLHKGNVPFLLVSFMIQRLRSVEEEFENAFLDLLKKSKFSWEFFD